ncbi:MAG: dienelactone hydrolase family protein [Mesorhizobium sp.]|nr:dienelactone hydrolase family protein [Mesorhizobium sp.]
MSETGLPATPGQSLVYREGGIDFSGRIVMPDGTVRGGLIYAPDWYGIYDYPLAEARRFASLGFAVMVADVYGAGVRITSDAQATQASQFLRDNPRTASRRMQAAVRAFRDVVLEVPFLAAVGFSLGGFCLLEMLIDAPLVHGAVILSGALGQPDGDYAAIETPIRFHHGTRDVLADVVRLTKIVAWLDAKGCDCALTLYAGAKHAFTNPNLPSHGDGWLGYDARYAGEANAATESFLLSLKG